MEPIATLLYQRHVQRTIVPFAQFTWGFSKASNNAYQIAIPRDVLQLILEHEHYFHIPFNHEDLRVFVPQNENEIKSINLKVEFDEGVQDIPVLYVDGQLISVYNTHITKPFGIHGQLITIQCPAALSEYNIRVIKEVILCVYAIGSSCTMRLFSVLKSGIIRACGNIFTALKDYAKKCNAVMYSKMVAYGLIYDTCSQEKYDIQTIIRAFITLYKFGELLIFHEYVSILDGIAFDFSKLPIIIQIWLKQSSPTLSIDIDQEICNSYSRYLSLFRDFIPSGIPSNIDVDNLGQLAACARRILAVSDYTKFNPDIELLKQKYRSLSQYYASDRRGRLKPYIV